MKPYPTAERLRALVSYDPATGDFTRISGKRAGHKTGTAHYRGYILINIDGKLCLAHRLAVIWMTGAEPVGVVDHINGDTGANRWDNLRDVPQAINTQNRVKACANNKTGLLGVTHDVFSGNSKQYRARIGVDGKSIHIGHYMTAQEAHAAYMEAKRVIHVGCRA